MNKARVFGAVVVVVAGALLIYGLVWYFHRPAPTPEPVVIEPDYLVAIDPGHGGRDPGAVEGDIYEKDVNLAIAKKVKQLIDADPTMATVMTRDIDLFVSLEDRIAFAEEQGADLYVSIHINSFSDPGVGGVEVLVDNARADDDPSYVLASMLQDALTEATGWRDRGVRSQESYLQRTTMPAASAEIGYLSNPSERESLTSEAFQQTIAQAVVQGIRDFLTRQYPAPATSEAS